MQEHYLLLIVAHCVEEAFMLMLFHDIVSGVQALHQRGLLHTDLKTLNVMMSLGCA